MVTISTATLGKVMRSERDFMVQLSASKVLRILMLVVCLLVVAHVAGLVARFGFGYDTGMGIIPLFNLEREGNIPTLFSVVDLVVASFASLLGRYASEREEMPNRRYWLGLVAIFLYMALDEGVGLHEMTMEISRRFFGSTGMLYYAWLIPFGLLAIGIGLLYLRFLLSLPRRTAILFFAGGAIFLLGAVGMELLESPISERGDYQSLQYMILVTFEEFFEMTGIVIFIYGVVDYVATRERPLSITFGK